MIEIIDQALKERETLFFREASISGIRWRALSELGRMVWLIPALQPAATPGCHYYAPSALLQFQNGRRTRDVRMAPIW